MPVFRVPNQSVRWLLAELAVVVLGILIAFQVDEWRIQNIDKRQESTTLAALLLDLESENGSLNVFLADANQQIEALKILQKINDHENSQDAEWVAQQYRAATLTQLWQPSSTTYAGLRGSGNMDLISSQELLGELVGYYENNQSSLSLLINDMRSARDEFLKVLGRDIFYLPTSEFTIGTDSLAVNIVQPIANMPRHPDFYAYYGSYAYRISILRSRLEQRLESNINLQALVRSHFEEI